MSDRIWLTWEKQRRNRTLSTKLNADLYEIIVNGSRFKRYPSQILQTIKVILKNKPKTLFVQNPSLLLSATTVLLSKFTDTSVVIDAHNAGLFPLEGRYFYLNKLAGMINSLADKVIVSNSPLIKFVKKDAGDVFAVPDPIPVLKKNQEYPFNKDIFNLVFICSWAEDEPYVEILRLAENVSDKVQIYMTGNSRGKEKSTNAPLPKNVTLTGFISDSEYEDLLLSCDAVMVLTKREDCLVCGAYEGVGVEKPMILSKTTALVDYFNKGCVYTDNSEKDIEDSILEVIDNYECLSLEIGELKEESEIRFHDALEILIRRLSA